MHTHTHTHMHTHTHTHTYTHTYTHTHTHMHAPCTHTHTHTHTHSHSHTHTHTHAHTHAHTHTHTHTRTRTMQASNTGVDQLLTTAISDGVEELCQCGFSADHLNHIILQCFPDNQEKINVLLFVEPTPSTTTSEILALMNTWINGNPQIMLTESNTTLSIDSDCDIETIQGSECNSDKPTPTITKNQNITSPTSPSNVYYNGTSTENASVTGSESKGRDLAIVGGIFLTLALVTIAIVVVFLVVLVRYRVVKIDSFRV